MASSASDRLPRPLIGLTTYAEPARMLVWETEFVLLHREYVRAVEQAGGTAVLLPPQEHGAEELVGRLDGLVLTGGADVDPARYGHQPVPTTGVPRPDRDGWELALLHRAIELGTPLLAVCRGAQVLNVGLGGTLVQHLPDALGSTAHQPAPGRFGSTRVDLEPGSAVAGLLGPAVSVHCYHHQALDRVADGLQVTGRAADGTVEAVELPGAPFVLGVQWHPEQDRGDGRLFHALVAAARTATLQPEGAPT